MVVYHHQRSADCTVLFVDVPSWYCGVSGGPMMTLSYEWRPSGSIVLSVEVLSWDSQQNKWSPLIILYCQCRCSYGTVLSVEPSHCMVLSGKVMSWYCTVHGCPLIVLYYQWRSSNSTLLSGEVLS